MPNRDQSILRFILKSADNPLKVMSGFFPQGKTVLNRTEWQGKEPRSCGITNVKMRQHSAGSNEPMIFDIEVTYRPKGCVTFVGQTKYDGWTALIIDRKNDGTLLDGHGQPLAPDLPPVYLPFEVHGDVEFNEIDFGEFVGEFEIDTVSHLNYDDVISQIQTSPPVRISIQSTFIAPRRRRPLVKIVISDTPSGVATDGFGTRIVNVNAYTPHLGLVLLDELMDLVSGFVEGRYSIKNISNDKVVYVELSDVIVDCTSAAEGDETRFNCLSKYLPDLNFDELAKRLMATYELQVSVVDGAKPGLLLAIEKTSAST